MKKALASVLSPLQINSFLAASLLGMSLAFLLIPYAAAEVRSGKGLSPVLDGKVFVVAVAPLGSPAGITGRSFQSSGDRDFGNDRSVFTFADGRFHLDSKRCADCSDGIYRSTVIGDSVSFEAETAGNGGERVVWQGTLRGADLFGTAVRTTPEGGRTDYTFYGRAGDWPGR